MYVYICICEYKRQNMCLPINIYHLSLFVSLSFPVSLPLESDITQMHTGSPWTTDVFLCVCIHTHLSVMIYINVHLSIFTYTLSLSLSFSHLISLSLSLFFFTACSNIHSSYALFICSQMFLGNQ